MPTLSPSEVANVSSSQNLMAATEPAKATPSAAPLSKRKPVAKREEKISTHVALVSQSGNAENKKALPSPSPAAAQDRAKARDELKER